MSNQAFAQPGTGTVIVGQDHVPHVGQDHIIGITIAKAGDITHAGTLFVDEEEVAKTLAGAETHVGRH